MDLCSSGVWAHVCHQSWDTNDARVACRELGLPSVCMQFIAQDIQITITMFHFILVPKALVGSIYGERNGPTIMNNVRCVGDEQSLLDCPHEEVGEFSCNSYDDIVSLVCSDGKFASSFIHA